jgi:hypothetical protein
MFGGADSVAAASAADRELAELAEVLRDVIKLSGMSSRRIEKLLGLAQGELARLLAGAESLKVLQLLKILHAIGMEPVDFFHWVYTTRQSAASSPSPIEVLADLRSGVERPAGHPSQGGSDGRTTELLLDALRERLVEDRERRSQDPPGSPFRPGPSDDPRET